mgnify:CR=1 FL=1
MDRTNQIEIVNFGKEGWQEVEERNAEILAAQLEAERSTSEWETRQEGLKIMQQNVENEEALLGESGW